MTTRWCLRPSGHSAHQRLTCQSHDSRPNLNGPNLDGPNLDGAARS
jgi:hypothetical protein